MTNTNFTPTLTILTFILNTSTCLSTAHSTFKREAQPQVHAWPHHMPHFHGCSWKEKSEHLYHTTSHPLHGNKSTRMEGTLVPFVVPSNTPHISLNLHKRQHFIKSDPVLTQLSPSKLILSYTKHKNINDLLGREQIHSIKPKSLQTSKHKNCITNTHLHITNTLTQTYNTTTLTPSEILNYKWPLPRTQYVHH